MMVTVIKRQDIKIESLNDTKHSPASHQVTLEESERFITPNLAWMLQILLNKDSWPETYLKSQIGKLGIGAQQWRENFLPPRTTPTTQEKVYKIFIYIIFFSRGEEALEYEIDGTFRVGFRRTKRS